MLETVRAEKVDEKNGLTWTITQEGNKETRQMTPLFHIFFLI